MSHFEKALEIEIVGPEAEILVTKEELRFVGPMKTFRQRGAGGEAGLVGIITSISGALLPNLFGVLIAERDRDLVLKVNGLELTVRDLRELDDLIDLLQAKGILPAQYGNE